MAEEDNVVDFANFFANERQRAASSAVFALDQDPDQAARAMQLAQATQVDPALIAPDVPRFEQQTKAVVTQKLFDSNRFLREYANSNQLAPQVSNDDWGQLDRASTVLQQLHLGGIGRSIEAIYNQPQLGKIASTATEVASHAFGYEQLNKEFWELDSLMKGNPLFVNDVIRRSAQAFAVTPVVLLKGLSGLFAGASAAVGETYTQLGGNPAEGQRLTRDVLQGINVFMPELGLGIPAMSAAAAHFRLKVGSWVESGRAPPPGVHPTIDAMLGEQAALDAKVLASALKESLASTTRERAPDMYAGFARQVTEGDLGLPAAAVRALYGDKAPVAGDGILGWVPRIDEQLRAAEATGADIQVPIADWLANVDPQVAKALEEHVRARPDGVTPNEAVVAKEAQAAKDTAGIEAWHGSPHEFEAFSSDKIGTGEGAQSYGYGHYVAEAPEVAGQYAERLSTHREEDQFGNLKILKPQLYRVRIKRHPDEFLDWDVPLNQQLPEIQAALRSVLKQEIDWNQTGGDFVRGLGTDPGGQNAKLLADAGIAGIKYLDQGSRGAKDTVSIQAQGGKFVAYDEFGAVINEYPTLEAAKAAQAGGTRNYVVFRDQDLEVITRNGEALRAVREAAGLKPLQPTPESTTRAKQLSLALPDTTPMDQRRAFEKGAAIGMTEEQYKLYERRLEDQASADQAKARARIVREERKRQSADWKEKEHALRPEVVEEVYSRPPIAADRLLREGYVGDTSVGEWRIGTEFLTKEQQEALPRNYYRKNGVDPSLIAEMSGYPSADALIAGLTEYHTARGKTRPDDFQRQIINAEVSRQMEARYGKLEENIMEKALEQVLSETQMQLLHEETLARALKAGVQFSITQPEFAKMVADRFAELNVKQVKSNRFIANAGKAERETQIALLKKDYETAFQQAQLKYRDATAGRLAVEYEAQRRELDALAKKYRPREIEGVDPAARYYIQQLLGEAGYKSRMLPEEIANELAALGHASLGDFVEGKFRDGAEPKVADWIMNEGAKPIDSMSVAEFREFKDAIDSLDLMGRKDFAIEIAGERIAFDKWKREQVLPLIEARPVRELEEGPGKSGAQGRWFYGIDAVMTRPETIVRALDLQKELGPLFKGIIVPIDLSKAKSYDYLKDLTKKLDGMSKELGNKWYKTLEETIPNDFINDTRDGALFDLTRWNMIKMMLNWGNPENALKLVDGIARAQLEPGIKPAPEHLQLIEARLDQMFRTHAKAEDWKYVQTIWDIFEGYKGDIETLQRSMSGAPPKWVEGRVLDTPFGQVQGKYFPLFLDKARNVGRRVETPTTLEGVLGKDYQRATTNQHHLDERTGARYFVDITNGPEQLIGRIQQVIHDLSFRDSVVQVHRIINDPDIRAAINKHYGPEYYKQFDPWIKRIARANNIDEGWLSDATSIMSRARLNLTMAALPLNPNVMFTPSLGTFNIKKIIEFYANRTENNKLVMENSKELPHLLYSLDRDAGEAMARIAGAHTWTSFQKSAMEKMYWGLVQMEKRTRKVTWYGEYMEQKGLGRTDYEASAWADSEVRRRHGVSHFADLSNLMASRNEFVRVPTMFMGYFSTVYNWQRDIPDLVRQNRVKEAFAAAWGVYGIAALYNYAIFTRPKEDEPWYKHLARAVISTPFAMIPYIREGYGYFAEGYQPRSPITGFAYAVGKVAQDGIKFAKGERPKRPVRNAAELVGQGLGVPGAVQIGRWGEFAYDVSTGEQKPKNIIEWGRGILFGESKLRK